MSLKVVMSDTTEFAFGRCTHKVMIPVFTEYTISQRNTDSVL